MIGREGPLVSVLTPVFNGAQYLEECIESVLQQTYQNYEYIIVNNCSKDATLAIAEKYALLDERIKVITNEAFLSVIDNHNNAFNRMSPKAKYCKVVSGDDALFPTCLARMVALAEANPSVGIVGCYQLSGGAVRWQGFAFPQQVFPGTEICRRNILEWQVFVDNQGVLGFGSPTSLLYRADLVRRTKAFYPNPSPHSDTSACFECLLNTDYGFVYEVLSYERIHEETQTFTSKRINRFLSAKLSDLLRYGPEFLTPDEMQIQLKRHLESYHRYLTISFFMRSSGPEFWDYHRSRLRELGFPFRRIEFIKAAVSLVLNEIINPGLAVEKLLKRLGSTRIKPNKPTQVLDSGTKRI